VTILWCKDCNRYLQPPKHWVRAELESKELLTFCLKRIRGLQVGDLGRGKGGGGGVLGGGRSKELLVFCLERITGVQAGLGLALWQGLGLGLGLGHEGGKVSGSRR
jgi:hypothetical protein